MYVCIHTHVIGAKGVHNERSKKDVTLLYILYIGCVRARVHTHTLYILCIYYVLCRRHDVNNNNEW